MEMERERERESWRGQAKSGEKGLRERAAMHANSFNK